MMRHYPPRPANRPGQTHRSQGRDSWKQERFRRAVLERDGHRCQEPQPDGSICGRTQDLRACHLIAFVLTRNYDVDNGITRCAECDRATDTNAR